MDEVLVIGNGGREATIANAMFESDEVTRVEVHAKVEDGLAAFTGHIKPFVIIGPEAPLIDGLADDLRDNGYTVFGASKAAAQFEASKSKTVRLAREAGVVHPATFIAEGEIMPDSARAFVQVVNPFDYVIKADGTWFGKAVELPGTKDEAAEIVEAMLRGEYGGAGLEIINFANRKAGPEVSILAVVGKGKDDFVILPPSQDHKRLLDGDGGPNTGGMGAYSHLPEHILSPAQYQKIEAKVYRLLEQMEKNGVLYEGAVLYLGLMMSEDLAEDDESDLLEINVRFGDPESQVVFPVLTKAGIDSYRLLRSAAERSLEKPNVNLASLGYAALSICLAAKGYPVKPRKGNVIKGLNNEYDNVSIQLAGVTRNSSGKLVTNGGRVLYVTGLGETVDDAAGAAYAAIGENAIHFAGYQYRTDIGWQARSAA